MKSIVLKTHANVSALCGIFAASLLSLAGGPALAQRNNLLPLPPPAVSTIPANGDVNPYGVAFVPRTVPSGGVLEPGDILVSNFNNAQNLQGTGTTIIKVSPNGQTSLFFEGQPPLGLTAALGILPNGMVLVGNLPTADGTSATAKQGSLLVIDRFGHLLGALTDQFINGPWGMAIHNVNDRAAQIFVSNVLSGTISRFDAVFDRDGDTMVIEQQVTVASGFHFRGDPAALELGPSGLAYDAEHDILYAASSLDNAVFAIAGAGRTQSSLGTGTMLFQDLVHLHGPLDLLLLPNGHFLIANSDGSNADPNQPSELTEYSRAGEFLAQYSVDPNNGGAFGVGVSPIGSGAVRVAAVDDNANTLQLWTTVIQ